MSADNFVDDSSDQCDQQRITEAVNMIAQGRGLIEQTKGMLMLIYGIDGEAAFNLLTWQSQQHNVKLRLIAERIGKELIELFQSTSSPIDRRSADRVVLTAHQRTATDATPTSSPQPIP